VAFSPDSQQLAGVGDERIVQFRSSTSGEILRVFKGPAHAITSVAFSPNIQQLGCGGFANIVWVGDTGSGEGWRFLKGHTNQILSVFFFHPMASSW
jgi:WD40 repeat protein